MEDKLEIHPSDMRIALFLSEEAVDFRKTFLEHNTNPLLKQMFSIRSLSNSTNNGPLNIRSLAGSKVAAVVGEYWLLSTKEHKDLYSKVVPDLYLFLTQMDERELKYKFIEVMERHFLIRGKFSKDSADLDINVELLTRIYPFEDSYISV